MARAAASRRFDARPSGGARRPPARGTQLTVAHYIATREQLERRSGELFRWLADGSLKVRVQEILPVWPFEFDGRLMASTRDKAWKLKRIQNDPHVLIATCTQRGKQTGPSYDARARILDSSQVRRALRAKRRRWWIQRLTEPLDRGTEQVPFEIYIPDSAGGPSAG